MLPAPASRMPGTACRASSAGAVTLTAMRRSMSSADMSVKWPVRSMPALFTRIVTGAPAASAARATTSRRAPASARSAASACPPISPASVSRAAAVRATHVTVAPRAARRRAMASPSPRDAPVTSAC